MYKFLHILHISKVYYPEYVRIIMRWWWVAMVITVGLTYVGANYLVPWR